MSPIMPDPSEQAIVLGLDQQRQIVESQAAVTPAPSVVELLWRHRNPLWKSVVLGFLVFAGIAFIIPKQYESTTRLMPPDSSAVSGSAMVAALASNLPFGSAGWASSLLGIKSPGALTIGVLQSRTVQNDLVTAFDLKKVYSCKTFQDARKVLSSSTSISEDPKSGIITIAVVDKEPHRAQALANGYVEHLNDTISKVSTSAAQRERMFLEERLQKVKQDLDTATLQLENFSSKNMTFDPSIQGKAMLDAAEALQAQLIAAASELSGLEQIYGSENSRVKSSKARVSALRSKLNELSGRAGQKHREGDPASQTAASELYPSLEQLPLLSGTYVDLARRTKIDEAVYEILTKQYELAKVQEAKEVPAIKVLDPADFPERKSFPPRKLISIAGALLTGLVVLTLILMAEYFGSLHSTDNRILLLKKALAKFTLDQKSKTPSS